MKPFILFAAAGLASMFFSCKKYQAAPEAFFISNTGVSAAPTATQGSSSQNITDYFLYVNGQFQGVYRVGSTMPIVSRGQNVSIKLLAGIKNNGIKDRSIPWNMYERLEIDTFVESGKTINRNLTFKYNPNTKFTWMEDFDNQFGVTLVKHMGPNPSDTMWKYASAGDSFEGKSIEFGLNCSKGCDAIFESSLAYPLPTGPDVYLELNYKCNAVFEVGVTDGITLRSALYINPKTEWNKIYIQLADAINQPPVQDKYKIYFRLLQPNDGDNPRVWLDNIKLVHL